jgi:hypothetical protein
MNKCVTSIYMDDSLTYTVRCHTCQWQEQKFNQMVDGYAALGRHKADVALKAAKKPSSGSIVSIESILWLEIFLISYNDFRMTIPNAAARADEAVKEYTNRFGS